ncbi:MAG: ATP-binding protein [Methanomicrobiales archaeon]|nr:ATP-binding protein [Methanomicrobiales archaeon]
MVVSEQGIPHTENDFSGGVPSSLEALQPALVDILETLSEGILLVDQNGKIFHYNKAFLEMWKITPAKVPIGTSMDSLISDIERQIDLSSGKDISIFRLSSQNLVASGTIRLRDGRIIQQSTAPLRGDTSVKGRVLTSCELNDGKWENKRLQQCMEDLKQCNDDLTQFTYFATHDLQEPLRAILGFSQLLHNSCGKKQLEGESMGYIQNILNAGFQMHALVVDLLEYSHITNRAKILKAVSCEELVSAVCENLCLRITKEEAQVSRDPLPVVMADTTQLYRVFQNLLDNALKFRSEKPPRIHISARSIDRMWQFTVQDNGIGIEPEYCEKIFQIFQRLNTRNSHPGTGLGLAITKRIVQSYGGRIWVESEPGKGSTFYFTLPAGKRSEKIP